MPDELTTPPVVTPPATSDQSFINPDGTYKEGWKDALLPEELRNEHFYDSPFNTDVKELLKTAGNQAKMLGKKGVIPITEKSSPFEIQEWRRATGVPDKYLYEKPTDLEMYDIPDTFINETFDEFNKLNMTQGQVDSVMKRVHGLLKSMEAEYTKAEEDERKKVNQQILMDENTEYETNSHYIDTVVRRFTEGWTEEDVVKLFAPADYGDGINSKDHIELKPLFRKFLVNVGKATGEGRIVLGDAGGKSLEDQLEEVMKSPEYLTGFGKVHTDAINKALKLREQLNKQQGRT